MDYKKCKELNKRNIKVRLTLHVLIIIIFWPINEYNSNASITVKIGYMSKVCIDAKSDFKMDETLLSLHIKKENIVIKYIFNWSFFCIAFTN